MELILIGAISQNNIIGLNGKLPWNIKEEWDYFLTTTEKKTIICGRITYEEIKSYNFSNKWNCIVLSRNPAYKPEDVTVVKSLNKAINYCKALNEENVFIIGGAEPFKKGLKIADKIYLTTIDKEYDGDTYFPTIDYKNWILLKSRKLKNKQNIKIKVNCYQKNYSQQRFGAIGVLGLI